MEWGGWVECGSWVERGGWVECGSWVEWGGWMECGLVWSGWSAVVGEVVRLGAVGRLG